jgi:Zn-finger nucleic acid-binding protein
MKCPTCKDAVLAMSDRHGIEIDYCPQCRGVWLDRGELDKIIERAAADQAEVAQPQPAQHQPVQPQPIYVQQPVHYGRDSYKYKRKKSFLEELFD